MAIDLNNEISDEKIVEIVCHSDQEQFAVIMRRYQNKIARYVSYLISDESSVADIVQETFIKAYIHLNGFHTKKKFSSWLYRIAHNTAMSAVRSAPKQLGLESDFEINEVSSNEKSLEEAFIRNELATTARTCVQELSIEYRAPLSLYFFEEKTYDEISDILKLPIGTVGTRINRGKKILKELCKQKNL